MIASSLSDVEYCLNKNKAYFFNNFKINGLFQLALYVRFSAFEDVNKCRSCGMRRKFHFRTDLLNSLKIRKLL